MDRLQFDQEQHVYSINGKPVPSVTRILRDVGYTSGFQFKGRIHAFRGHTVHHACGLIDQGAMLDDLFPIELESPWDRNEEYVKVAGEIPGYCSAFMDAKKMLGFQGTIYECPLISVRDGYAGSFDFLAWGTGAGPQLWDIKSGVYTPLTVIQICAYEDLSKNGQPVNQNHPGLDTLRAIVDQSPDRCGLRLEKQGRFTSYFETPKGESHSSPKWMVAWKSALYLHKNVPGHEYVFNDDQGRPVRGSHLSDVRWLQDAIQETEGKLRDRLMQAAANVYTIREAYRLL